MENKLENKKIAVLAAEGVEQTEFSSPIQKLIDEGAEVDVISLRGGKIKSWNKIDWGESFPVDIDVAHADSGMYDALFLPGGVMSPDKLRRDSDAIKFVKSFFDMGKPIASICHGIWMLIEAGAVMNRNITSWPSLKTDVKNAGGNWIDEEVVVDEGIVTSRKTDDIPAFNEKMVEEFAEGIHTRIK